MLSKRILTWWVVWLGLMGVAFSASWLLQKQSFHTTGQVVGAVFAMAAYLWLVGGVFFACQKRFVLLTALYMGVGILGIAVSVSFAWLNSPAGVLGMLGVTACIRCVQVYRAYAQHLSWRLGAMALLGGLDVAVIAYVAMVNGFLSMSIMLLGVYGLCVVFLLGLWLMRRVLSQGNPMAGVARTLIEEAIRMRITLVLLLIILLMIPILPYVVGPTGLSGNINPQQLPEFLKNRIATFLSWSLGVSSVLLSVMTLFLSCSTICNEIKHKQIYMTLTKPIGPGQYLLGKWLGIAALNLLLIAVIGGGIFTLCLLMKQLPARDGYDRQAVTEEILTARLARFPTPVDFDSVASRADAYLNQMVKNHEYVSYDAIPSAKRKQIAGKVINKWHTIEPGASQSFEFGDLKGVKQKVAMLQLRIKPSAGTAAQDDLVHFQMRLNGRPYPMSSKVIQGQASVIPLPASAIDDDGRLIVTMINLHATNPQLSHQSSISFTPGDGMKLYYPYGSFGLNLTKGMLMIWLQLCFVAMVGLAMGTFLSFPVAALGASLVYVTALSSSYLQEALSNYAVSKSASEGAWEALMKYPGKLADALGSWDIWEAMRVVIQLVGNVFVMLIPSFSKYNPVPFLAEGRAIEMQLLWQTGLMVGLVWTGALWAMGYFVFRKREMAGVIV